MGQVSDLDLCIYMYSTIGCLNDEATQSRVCNPFKLDCGDFCERTCNIAINGISKRNALGAFPRRKVVVSLRTPEVMTAWCCTLVKHKAPGTKVAARR
jgi:hypothetical protein